MHGCSQNLTCCVAGGDGKKKLSLRKQGMAPWVVVPELAVVMVAEVRLLARNPPAALLLSERESPGRVPVPS